MHSYDYAHRTGIDEISWERFAELAARLVEGLAAFDVEVIVGIARAGLFPATAVACMLRRELFPVRVTRRLNDEVIHSHPIWKVDVSPEVNGKVVAVIDEMADTGETLALVAQRAIERGVQRVITASLVAHSWAAPRPDVVALTTDALVIFPWDKSVYQDDHWQAHPELVEALKLQRSPSEQPAD
ncbi:MAG: phosphoribosyltransferase [Anaerolineae bacterium]